MRCSLLVKTGKHAGREVPIRGPRFLIGCADDCHLKLKPGQGRQYHCALLLEDEGIWLRDYGGGTVVSGVRIVDRRLLSHADRLEFGPLHFELQIQDPPAKANDRVSDMETQVPGATIVEKLPERIERPIAVAPELAELDCNSVIVAGWSPPTESSLTKAPAESPKAVLWPLTAPAEQAEPVAVPDASDLGNVRAESPKVSAWPLTAPIEQAEPAAAPDLNDLGNARPEPPNASTWPLTAPTVRAEQAGAAGRVGKTQSEPPTVIRPWYATSSAPEPAPVVATTLLRRFFLVRKGAFSDQDTGRRITAREIWAGLVSVFMKLIPSENLDPNVMFFLGILVGIGLSAAGLAFFSIAGK